MQISAIKKPLASASPAVLVPILMVHWLLFGHGEASGKDKFVANYDEAKIPDHELPNPLVATDGSTVTTAEEWNKKRRPELMSLFENHVYGVAPESCSIRSTVISENSVLDGRAIRREVDVFFGLAKDAHSMRLLIYTPAKVDGAVPAFMGLNFQGNHSVDPDPTISLGQSWVRDRKNESTSANKATEKARGVASSRWPFEEVIDHGYALVTIYYGDIDPDFDDGFKNGIHGKLGANVAGVPQESAWGSIAAWAYGLSRALDYLHSDDCPSIDGDRVAVLGHSRLGKTSLWAGASDPRFAMVISNDSGCGGAAISRRAIGETIGRINSSFPHWFCDQFTKYNENENACPVDQHQLISLVAPRPVYIASATADKWADPKGEFLSAVGADPVYRLLGTNGIGVSPVKMPEPDQPIASGQIGYHLRTGKHDLTKYDWQQYLKFADRHLK